MSVVDVSFVDGSHQRVSRWRLAGLLSQEWKWQTDSTAQSLLDCQTRMGGERTDAVSGLWIFIFGLVWWWSSVSCMFDRGLGIGTRRKN